MWPLDIICAMIMVSSVTSTGPRSAFVQRLEPRDFSGTEYFLTESESGGQMSHIGGQAPIVEDLRRGQEGLMVKLNDVTRSIKEDELKLNNIFYKIGRHDTDLEGVGDNVKRLSKVTKKIESKLNKHAFNVDFLRRKVESMATPQVVSEHNVEVQLATARTLINRLEDRLTDALARLGTVENTTQTLQKRSAPQYSDMYGHSAFALHSRPPTLSIYPEGYNGISALTGKCYADWEEVGTGCYWFGGEELTFTEATAYCIRNGGHLLTLSPPGDQLSLLLNRLKANTVYWTSGTNAFNKDNWEFLMTATPVMPLHWAILLNKPENFDETSHRCAGVSNHGLIKKRCTNRLPYICHII